MDKLSELLDNFKKANIYLDDLRIDIKEKSKWIPKFKLICYEINKLKTNKKLESNKDWIKIYSPLVDDKIIFIINPNFHYKTIPVSVEIENETLYYYDELQELSSGKYTKEEILKIHEIKKTFSGKLLTDNNNKHTQESLKFNIKYT